MSLLDACRLLRSLMFACGLFRSLLVGLWIAQKSACIYASELLRSLMYVFWTAQESSFLLVGCSESVVSLLTVQDLIVCYWPTWDSHCFLVNFSGVYLFACGLLRSLDDSFRLLRSLIVYLLTAQESECLLQYYLRV
jgi:hypothetical protein